VRRAGENSSDESEASILLSLPSSRTTKQINVVWRGSRDDDKGLVTYNPVTTPARRHVAKPENRVTYSQSNLSSVYWRAVKRSLKVLMILVYRGRSS
jgi:hypothetical protein